MFDILSYNGFCKKRRHSMTFSVYFAPYLLETMNNFVSTIKTEFNLSMKNLQQLSMWHISVKGGKNNLGLIWAVEGFIPRNYIQSSPSYN